MMLEAFSFSARLGKRIYVIFCKDQDRHDRYFVIRAGADKMRALRRVSSIPADDLAGYGEILASGTGAKLSQEVRDLLKNTYRVDPGKAES